ncbi:uncharacterized protein LOC142606237 [Castanea sativa]|uniref:uncharacterized protein LOC142606237 n=1 Tax=Castanea sativa TaxID=21020 RepID=UPI003F64CA4B
MPYLKCVNEEEAKYILEEIHEGICGDHAGPRSLVDARELVKNYDKCQRFENVQHLPAEKLTKIASPWPFAQWGIDIVGPLPRGKRFSIPQMIISDNRRQFDSQRFRDFCSSLGIKNQLDDAKGAWPEELPNVLWAYKTIARTPIGETPFRLTYGTKAVIPVEVGITSIGQGTFHEEGNNDKLKINLDCLDEIKEEASNRMTKYQQKMTKYFNKRVKLKRLNIGDLVLRKIT